ELLVRAIPWVKVPFLPPNFVVIELHNGTPTPYQCHASRGTLKMSPDRVCWVNKDTQDHVIQFLNGQWPFLPSQNPGNRQILVPALGGSGWYAMTPIKGVLGVSITYDYSIDIPFPPPGPGVIGDD